MGFSRSKWKEQKKGRRQHKDKGSYGKRERRKL
jgi:hypothetical protein